MKLENLTFRFVCKSPRARSLYIEGTFVSLVRKHLVLSKNLFLYGMNTSSSGIVTKVTVWATISSLRAMVTYI